MKFPMSEALEAGYPEDEMSEAELQAYMFEHETWEVFSLIKEEEE